MGGQRSQTPGSPWTLEALLREYPWHADACGAVEPLNYLWEVEVDASREELWEHLIDTSRLNRALGISRMHFEERDGQLHGESRPGGLGHRWVEVPWNWVSGRTMSAERVYSAGFSKYARVRYDVARKGGKVVLYAYFGFVPRNWLYRWVLRLGMRSLEKRFHAVIEGLSRGAGAAPALEASSRAIASPAIVARVEAIASSLRDREVSEPALEALLSLVLRGDDMDVHRLQVRKLARSWNLSERKVLHLCLHATRLGLLELSWDVICPHCRGARVEAASLGGIPKRASCEPCALEFGTDGPNAIEITFRIHPSIRDVPKQMFCSAQTAERRHVEIQQVLGPGEERDVDTLLPVGRYRLRTLREPGEYAYLDVGSLDDSIDETKAGGSGPVTWRASQLPADCRFERSPSLQLVNDSEGPVSFIVEDVNWADEALRPAQLFCYQGFRDLFSEEYIGADVHLAIGEQVILFTDIVGSTKLYLDRGDPQAFSAVRRHFTEVFSIVDEHEGAVVKTIGDATMAAFSDTSRAIAAARAIHERFPADEEADLTLRISINTGVCIAVNLNSAIDYFGNAVNLAAKLQLLAGAGDIVISDAARNAPGVQAYLAAENVELEPVTFDFDALGKTVTAHRHATAQNPRGRRNSG